MAALRSSSDWSLPCRTSARSKSKKIGAVRSVVSWRSRAASAAAASRAALPSSAGGGGVGAGASVGAGAGSGAGCSGSGVLPQAATSTRAATIPRMDEARIITPALGVGNSHGPGQTAGPVWQPGTSRRRKLTDPAGLAVDDPELTLAAPGRHRRDLTAVGRLGLIFVTPGGRERAKPATGYREHVHLRRTLNLTMERDRRAVG